MRNAISEDVLLLALKPLLLQFMVVHVVIKTKNMRTGKMIIRSWSRPDLNILCDAQL